MNVCRISIFLAYGMALYCMASLYYFIRTRSVGTPFKDSLSPKQIKIKKESVNVRKNIFYQGIGGSLVLLYFFKPFEKCL
jgi:hypothetical protein